MFKKLKYFSHRLNELNRRVVFKKKNCYSDVPNILYLVFTLDIEKKIKIRFEVKYNIVEFFFNIKFIIKVYIENIR